MTSGATQRIAAHTPASSIDNHIVVALRAAEALRDRVTGSSPAFAPSANDTLDKVSPPGFRLSAAAYTVVTYLAAPWLGRFGA